MSEYLFKVQLRNRLQQRGLLRRFTPTCIGEQPTLEDIKSEKSHILKKINEGKLTRNSKEYITNFFRYIPDYKNITKKNITKKQKTK